jgi:hypothetical protein
MKKNRHSIDEALEFDAKLEALAASRGTTKVELIRHALSLYALPQEDPCTNCDPVNFPLCGKCLGC